MNRKILFYLLPIFILTSGWGFFGHRQINRFAVFLLPSEMMGFYKYHIDYIQESAVNPDRRRYAVRGEAARHFLDMDQYAGRYLPKDWGDAVACYGEDSLDAHGTLPWNLMQTTNSLKNAFLSGDPERILRISADLGHYVGDAHVPLHTTSNYDGQKTGQHGLHAFWESRLPELYFNDYDLLIGKAQYVDDKNEFIWAMVRKSNTMVDSVLNFEKNIFRVMADQKFGFESRGNATVKAVTEEYSKFYHEALDGMVERQLRCSIRCVADLWFSAWVDAGQPSMDSLKKIMPTEQDRRNRQIELDLWKSRYFNPREHESGGF